MWTQLTLTLGCDNTIALSPSNNEIAWFKGNNEMMILGTESNEEIEDLGFFAKDSSIIGKIALIQEAKTLVTLTYDSSKSISYLNNFDVDSEKITSSVDFKVLLGNLATSNSNRQRRWPQLLEFRPLSGPKNHVLHLNGRGRRARASLSALT